MLEAFSLSDKGCVRSNNEDYCLIDAERGLYVLADGMGGAKAGERASRLAVETVAETVLATAERDSRLLIRAAEEANRRVLEASHSDPSLEGMGTTLVAAPSSLELSNSPSPVSAIAAPTSSTMQACAPSPTIRPGSTRWVARWVWTRRACAITPCAMS